MGYFLFVVLIAFGVYMYWGDKKKWKRIDAAHQWDKEALQEKFAYLKANGIPCRLQISGKGSAEFCKATPDPQKVNNVTLQIKKKDFEKAKRMLEKRKNTSD